MIRQSTQQYRAQEPGVEGTGPEPTAPASVDATPAAAPVDTSAVKPATMHDAMFPKATPLDGETQAQADQRTRDEKGRFATKAPVDPTAPKPVEATKPAAPEDITAMPEGLSPKAQERFQKLANSNKELQTQHDDFRQTIEPFRVALQSNGVTQQQFDQATQVVGMINRGDLAGAQTVLMEQLRMISLATGKQIVAVDALSEFPDLRQRVDQMQLSEDDAMELARNRAVQNGQQARQQREQQARNTQQQSQQLVQQGQVAVDTFCKRQMTTDMDYAKIEPLLLEQIKGGLLEGVPPARWAVIVEKTYGLIKQSASMHRPSPSIGGGVLRPSGADQARVAPKSMYEAMWSAKAPA